MKKKGRIQVGADADITVFDPATIIDRATYKKGDMPSAGIAYVLVGGTFVVYDSESVDGVFPGGAILSTLR
jgi:N-acyl-D-aspartate/D-glutamate deacylase